MSETRAEEKRPPHSDWEQERVYNPRRKWKKERKKERKR